MILKIGCQNSPVEELCFFMILMLGKEVLVYGGSGERFQLDIHILHLTIHMVWGSFLLVLMLMQSCLL